MWRAHTHIGKSQPYQLHASTQALTGQAFSTNKKSTTHQIQRRAQNGSTQGRIFATFTGPIPSPSFPHGFLRLPPVLDLRWPCAADRTLKSNNQLTLLSCRWCATSSSSASTRVGRRQRASWVRRGLYATWSSHLASSTSSCSSGGRPWPTLRTLTCSSWRRERLRGVTTFRPVGQRKGAIKMDPTIQTKARHEVYK